MCDPGPYAKESVSSNDVIPEITLVVVNSITFILFSTEAEVQLYTQITVWLLEELVCVCDVRGHKGHREDV